MNDDSFERNETYNWAHHHGLYDPYGFAIHFEDLWGSKSELVERARGWQADHIRDRKGALDDEMDELRRRIAILDADLERLETKEFE